MQVADLLARFDQQIRANPAPERGVGRCWADGVLRSEGESNFIDWWDFPAARAGEITRREAAYFGGRTVEWKLYSHDRPPGLAGALVAAGFAPGEAETLVAIDVRDAAPPQPARGVEIRLVRDPACAADYAAVSAAAFEREGADQLAVALGGLDDPGRRAFVAYADGEPVASGRLELPAGRAFAGLYGGGVVPAWRGRGLYRALVLARAAEARAHGYAYLTVDALETSRPILERMGFARLASVQGWTLSDGEI